MVSRPKKESSDSCNGVYDVSRGLHGDESAVLERRTGTATALSHAHHTHTYQLITHLQASARKAKAPCS